MTERRRGMRPDGERLVQVVADERYLHPEELLRHDRRQEVVLARHIAMYLLVYRCGYTVTSAGRTLNHGHAAVRHGAEKIRRGIRDDRKLLCEVERIWGCAMNEWRRSRG